MAKTSLLSQIQPAAGYLLVAPEEQQTQTASGIYLPDSAKGEKPQTGTVLAVGPDDVSDSGTKRPAPAKKNQRVVYKKWGGNEFKIENTEYLFVKFEDILAVIA